MSKTLVSLPCLILAVLLSTEFLYGKDPGFRVVVVNDKAIFAVSGKAAGEVAECTVFTVTKAEGEWLWVPAEKAYLRNSDVILFENAIDHYTRKLQTSKTAQNYWNRARIWRLKGEIDIALNDMNEAIRLNPNESEWFNNRGILWVDKKEYDRALSDYSEAIRLDPKNSDAFNNRGNRWLEKHDFTKAISDYDASLRFTDPTSKVRVFDEISEMDSKPKLLGRAVVLNNRGNAWTRMHEYDKALADYEEAIRLEPKYESPQDNRRDVWEKRGEWAKAVKDLESKLRETSNSTKTLNALAWIFATCPNSQYRDGRKAIDYARKACELTNWETAYILDSLAAAYAEDGQFDKAIQWQQKATVLAPKDQREDYESRITLYKEGKPFRQSPAK